MIQSRDIIICYFRLNRVTFPRMFGKVGLSDIFWQKIFLFYFYLCVVILKLMTCTQYFCRLLYCLSKNISENNMGRKGKELDTSVRNMVVEAYKNNRNTSELARILGIPRSTIRSIVKKKWWKGTGRKSARKR